MDRDLVRGLLYNVIARAAFLLSTFFFDLDISLKEAHNSILKGNNKNLLMSRANKLSSESEIRDLRPAV